MTSKELTEQLKTIKQHEKRIKQLKQLQKLISKMYNDDIYAILEQKPRFDDDLYNAVDLRLQELENDIIL